MALDPKTKETVREEALRLSKEFAELDGRRPRVLLIEMENDLESDREERKLAANALADSGWDVDVSPSQQPEDAANWLPVSGDEFHLFMRIYLPDMAALDAWQPPVIRAQ